MPGIHLSGEVYRGIKTVFSTEESKRLTKSSPSEEGGGRVQRLNGKKSDKVQRKRGRTVRDMVIWLVLQAGIDHCLAGFRSLGGDLRIRGANGCRIRSGLV